MRIFPFFTLLLLIPSALALDVVPPPLPGEAEIMEVSIANPNGGLLTRVHVVVEAETTTLAYIDDDGVLKLPLSEGSMTLRIDRVATPGKDYLYRGVVRDGMRLSPLIVGSATGIVQDEEGAVIRDAIVEARCSAAYLQPEATRTDRFGSFAIDWMPEGYCRFHAERDGVTGVAETVITGGAQQSMVITLSTPVRKKLWIPILIVILAATIVLAVVLSQRKRPKRSETILPTLRDRERAVVEFLMEHPRANQAKVIQETGVPKATLLRIIESLEQKQIVEVVRTGRSKRLRLTKWFRS